MTTTTGDTTSSSRFCGNCGAHAGAGRFCTGCGSPLVPAQRTQAEQPDPPVQDTQAQDTQVQETQVLTVPSAEEGDQDHEPWPVEEGFLLTDDPADNAVEEAAREPRRPDRRVIAFAVAVGLVLVSGIGYGIAAALDGGRTETALQVSAAQFRSVVDGLASARDLDDVASAAERARPAAERIAGEWRALERDRDTGVVVAQLKAEEGVLTSLSGLAAIAGEPLTVWGSEHGPITDALEAETETRTALAAARPDDARSLPDTGAMMAAVTEAVGSALGDDAASRAGQLLTTLGNATSTAGLRALAAQAVEEEPAVAAVIPALSAETGRPALEAYSRVLEAFERLGVLDGERTGSWGATRAELAAAVAQLAGSSPAAAGLNGQSADALGAAEKVVRAAAAAFADWEAAHAAAVDARKADAESLNVYAADVRAEIKRYEVLRNDLSGFLERVEREDVGVTYAEAWSTLDDAVEARRSVRAVLTSLRVPAEMKAEHDELVGLMGRAIDAVQSAYDSVDQTYECVEDCYFRDMPAFRRFSSESAEISKDFGPAVKAWESAAGAAKATVENRPLPAKPEV